MGTFQDFFVALSGIYSQLSFLFYFQKIYILNCKQGIGWLMVFNAAINNIKAVRFIDGGNRITRRKPQTCRKSLTNFIT